MSETLNVIKKQILECVNSAYDKGYKDGIKDGNIDNGTFTKKIREAYNNGLNDAEKAVRRLVSMVEDGGLSGTVIETIFGTSQNYTILTNFSMPEIIEKIREYDNKKSERNASPDNELHIGDEVYILDKNRRATVTALLDNGNKANLLCTSGNYLVVEISELHKTGRRFAIDEVLRELKE